MNYILLPVVKQSVKESLSGVVISLQFERLKFSDLCQPSYG